MHGNVWEWCQDDWHDNYTNAPKDGSAWIGQSYYAVLRGGSWFTVLKAAVPLLVTTTIGTSAATSTSILVFVLSALLGGLSSPLHSCAFALYSFFLYP
jgi:hypothetical protein